jgi:hypothetical protein
MQQYIGKTVKSYVQNVGGVERVVSQQVSTFTGKVKVVSEKKKSEKYGSFFATAIAEMAPGRDVIVVGREAAVNQVLALKKGQMVVFDGRPIFRGGKVFFSLEEATIVKNTTRS